MKQLRHTAQAWHQEGLPAIVVEVLEVRGSTPREAGTRMLVSAASVEGTIGGGHLEWQAIDMARQALHEAANSALRAWTHTFPLGPTLGQCCGGTVHLGFVPLDDAALLAWRLPAPRFHLELHGAGHVGQAIAKLLADVDCTVRWIDERPDEAHIESIGIPTAQALAALPAHIQFLPTDAAEAEVRDAPPGACHLVLTHRHDLDLRIVQAILQRGDVAFLGMIGSRTKRAKFEHRLHDMGISEAMLARMVCPIGVPGLSGKEPAVIAISVVAQLLQVMPPGAHAP
jgi:xanthine dehydrogenase accessory factor